MTLTIRPAKPDDVPLLMEIEQESFSSPHWKERDFETYSSLVAEIDGRIAGFLVARETFGGSKEARPEREILNIAVAIAFRRIGVGTELLKRELETEADFFLEVRVSNQAAQELYSKFGFQEAGRRPGYYDSPPEPAIVMIRKWC